MAVGLQTRLASGLLQTGGFALPWADLLAPPSNALTGGAWLLPFEKTDNQKQET
jgi:hypothetical protein